MIERISARSGETAIKFQGRHLCSSVDPSAEARQWSARQLQSLAATPRVIVLGLGCGYHLQELRLHAPEIEILCLFVETDLEKTLSALRPSALEGVTAVNINEDATVFDCAKVRHFLRRPYRLLDFLPAQMANLQRYQEIRSQLLLRDPYYFSEFVRREERWHRLFPLRELPGGGEAELLTIKHLDRWMNSREVDGEADRLLIRTLRELVR